MHHLYVAVDGHDNNVSAARRAAYDAVILLVGTALETHTISFLYCVRLHDVAQIAMPFAALHSLTLKTRSKFNQRIHEKLSTAPLPDLRNLHIRNVGTYACDNMLETIALIADDLRHLRLSGLHSNEYAPRCTGNSAQETSCR